jgi:hypothetical protein
MVGVILLLSGDFRQILPVIQRGTTEIKSALASNHTHCGKNGIIIVKSNMKIALKEDNQTTQFLGLLLSVDTGQLPRN